MTAGLDVGYSIATYARLLRGSKPMTRHVGLRLLVAPLESIDCRKREVGSAVFREFRRPAKKPIAELVVVALQQFLVG
jgi:hypothetical protein